MSASRPLSLQIYSGRKFPPLESQLAILARLGYANIETFGALHEDAEGARKLMDKYGLTARSGHFGLDMIEHQPERALEIARELGVEFIVAPYLAAEQRPTDVAGWQALGARLATASRWFADHGLRFAWHNHDFEFVALPDGSHPIEHLLGADLLWEADLAWVVRGKSDPSLWIERYRGRIPLVHVKDLAPADQNLDEGGWADVGAGTLPWPALWAACVAAGAELAIAEHDNPKDFERFARVSAEAMRRFS